MQPVRIAGSGPAGLTAAINLARAGRPVQVYEQHGDGGQRFFGDIQGLENWSEPGDVRQRLQRLGLAINFDCTPFSQLTVTNGRKQWHFDCEKPAFYLVKRGALANSLDQGLKRQALELGVEILYHTHLAPEEADIVATGPMAHHTFAVARGEVFNTRLPDMAWGLVDDSAAFKGYSYLLVINGYGCICTVLFDRMHEINRCFAVTRQHFGKQLKLDMADIRPVGGVGSFALKPEFRRGKALLVGEAAGLQDLLWGFGMRSAMVSGWLAASCLLAGSDYQRQAERFFAPRLRASLVNRFLWERFGHESYARIMDRIAAAPDALDFLSSFHRFNRLQQLFYPWAWRFMKRRYPWLVD